MKVFVFQVGAAQDEAVVAAETQAEAVKLFDTTAYTFRAYGGQALPPDDPRCPVALAAPGVVWCRGRTFAAEDRLRGFLPWKAADRTPRPDVVVRWHVHMDDGPMASGEWRFDWWEWHGWPAERRQVELDDRLRDEITNHVDAGCAVVEGTSLETP